MIDKYLDYAIHYDYTFVVCKYTTQQILGSLQASEMGERFLASATMRDLCAVFGRESDLEKRKAWIKTECERLGFGLLPTSCEVSMRQGTLAPSKGAVADTRCVHYHSLLCHWDFHFWKLSTVFQMAQDKKRHNSLAQAFMPFLVVHFVPTVSFWNHRVEASYWL